MPSTSVFSKILGQDLADASHICQITATGETGNMGVQLSVVQGSTGVDRHYRLKVPANATGAGVWRRVVPFDKTEKFPNQNHWAVDIMSDNKIVTLRLVRTKVGDPASSTSLTCKVIASPSAGESVLIENSATTSQNVTNAGIYDGALITEIDGMVGINTDSPSHVLDVSGNVNVSGVYKISGEDVISSTNLGTSVTSSNLTSVGTLTGLAVSGNVALTGLGIGNTGNVVYLNPSSGAVSYGPISLDNLSGNLNASVGTLGNLTVTGNLAAGNLSGTSITGTLETAAQPNITSVGTLGTLSVTGNATTGNLSTTALSATTFKLNGSDWASSVIYGTTTPFTYTGPGSTYSNGVSFYTQTYTTGTAFVTASGTDNSIFTFSTAGTYMLQSEIDVSYPWMPDGDINTFYLVNGNSSVKFGNESHAAQQLQLHTPLFVDRQCQRQCAVYHRFVFGE